MFLQIDTGELPHVNSYVVNQSYEFVFHLTSSLQPPNKKVRTRDVDEEVQIRRRR